MKILILSPKLPFPPKDGGSVATLNMAAGLADAGNDITLFCLNTVKHYFPVEDIPLNIRAKIRFITVRHDTSPGFFSAVLNFLFSRKPYIAVRFRSSAFNKLLVKTLSEEKFDIIQVEGPYLSCYFRTIRKFSCAQISFRAQNVESAIWKGISKNTSSLLKKIYLNNLSSRVLKLEKKVLSESDLFVPITESDCRFFLTFRKDISYHIYPTGFDTAEFEKTKGAYQYSLFFLGALDWKPNRDGLLWFLKNVWTTRGFNTKFHVAGRCAPEWLKQKLYSTEGVVFHGEIENSADFISKYGIMICPILTGSGIRIKILDAMLMGKTIISTRVGAEGIPVTDGENIILCEKPEDFSRKILFLEKNSACAAELGSNAKKFVIKNFNNLALCKDLCDFYRKNLK